jgi:hypothetical protein
MRGTRAKAERKAGKRKLPRHKRFSELAFRAVLNSKTADQIQAFARDNGIKGRSKLSKGDLINKLVDHYKNARAHGST